MARSRTAIVSVMLAANAALSACGGGGGSDANGNPSLTAAAPGSSPVASAPAAPVVPQSNTPNVQPVVVQAVATPTRNMLTTSVTVCSPQTDQCATIDNVQVDTGSQGLRILASALPADIRLPPIASGVGTSAACAVFGTGFTWGTVRTADIRLAGQLAASVPIQLIADPAAPTVPSDCQNAGLPMMSATTLRVNGILGVGLFATDCGSSCASSALPRWYYTCDASGSCSSTVQPVALQVTNPVSRFAIDNNGVVIDLPAVADSGAPVLSGSLIFGIDTQANNRLNGATVLQANPQTGYIATTFEGQTYWRSFIDSGSNALFFPTATVATCGIWYCPPDTQALSATIADLSGTTAPMSFSVANAQTLFATSNYAFSNLAGAAGQMFDWGLPFFYGRRIYTAIQSGMTSAGPGPYYAF
jgi:hypothetical protein